MNCKNTSILPAIRHIRNKAAVVRRYHDSHKPVGQREFTDVAELLFKN